MEPERRQDDRVANKRLDEVKKLSVAQTLVRYLIQTIIATMFTLVIVQTIVVRNDVRGCERRQRIFKVVKNSFEDAGKASPPSSALGKELREASKKINKDIVTDCSKAYPGLFPFVT